MDNREDIDKLDRQINQLKNSEKELKEKELDAEREVIIDRKYEYDDIDGDTKRLDKIDDIEEFEEVEEPKKMTRVERLEEQAEQEEVIDVDEEKETRVGRLEDNQKEGMSKKKKIIIVCSIIGVILIALIVLLVVFNKDKKIETDVSEKLSKSEQKDIINDYGDALTKVVADYYTKQKVMLEYEDAVKLIDFDYNVKCSEHEIYESGDVYLNNCKIDKTKTKYSYGTKQEKVTPKSSEETYDVVGVYVNKKSNKATLETPDSKELKENYDVYEIHIDKPYTNISLLNASESDYIYYLDKELSVHMINFKTGVKALNPLNYTNILPINNEGENDPSYVAVEMNNLWGIYNLETRERIVNHEYRMIDPVQGINKKIEIYTVDLDIVEVFDGELFGLINYKTGKEIVPVIYKSIVIDNNYLLACDKSNVNHLLDFNNKEYLKDYDEVYSLLDDKYVLVKEDKSIKIVSPSGKEIYDYGEVESLKLFRKATSEKNQLTFIFKTDDEINDTEKSKYIALTYDTKTKKGKIEKLEYKDVFK